MTRTNEEQLDLFADLLEPAAEIFGDKEVAKVFQSNGKPATAVKIAIKNHKASVIELLARLDGQDVKTYKVPNPAALALKLLNLFNDPEISNLFTSQPQMKDAAASGAATGNTEGGAN